MTGTDAPAESLHHPAFARKLADRDSYRFEPERVVYTICGDNDLTPVNLYEGDLGESVEFVWQRHHMVGALEDDGDKYCSGTLIGRDLFLTAGHCVDDGTVGDKVAFNYERRPDDDGNNTQRKYRVSEVVEDANDDLDYAILRLEGSPGDLFGWTRIQSTDDEANEPLTIIQHPSGRKKEVEVGTLMDFDGDYVRYGDIDTQPGSSGSGIINSAGYLVGVHTNGGCTRNDGGSNRGVRMSRIYDASPVIRGIADGGQSNTPRGDVYVATSNGSELRERGWKWHDFFCVNNEDCHVGDVTGDGKDDLVLFVPTTGDVYVAKSVGSGNSARFDGTGWRWGAGLCGSGRTCRLGDVDGDGRHDVIAFTRGWSADVYVAKSTGSGFASAVRWHDSFCYNDEICEVGDFNGDDRDDIVVFTRGSRGDVYVALSTGTFFTGTGWKWHDSFCYNDEICKVGDADGDGMDDVVAFTRGSSADVYVATAYAYGFAGTGVKWHDKFCYHSEQCDVADVNGDGKDDVVAFLRGDAADVFAAKSTGSKFDGTGKKWHALFCLGQQVCRLGDVTGDGKADAVSFLRNP